MQLIRARRLWRKASHNAFTDFCEYQQRLFCCFREAQDHVSGDGKIRILLINKKGRVSQNIALTIPNADLRDPKLSVTPDGKLMLLAYARFAQQENSSRYTQPQFWLSDDGLSWSEPSAFNEKGWWLWRLTWHEQLAYGFAYNRNAQRIDLYTGDPRQGMERRCEGALSLEKHELGYPNESDLLFNASGEAIAIVRRDADSCTAQLGKSMAPYSSWQWHDLDIYLGGPAMLQVSSDQVVLAGRIWVNDEPKMALYGLDLRDNSLSKPLILPSAGDCSYPGLVLQDKVLWVSYYSCHKGNKSSIFLARVRLPRSWC